MLNRLVNLPFRVLNKAARAMQERQDAAAAARASQEEAARPAARRHESRAELEVPDDFAAGDDVGVSADQLRRWLAEDSPPLIVDVREEPAFRLGHPPDAANLPLSTLEQDLAELPPARRLVALGASDAEARLAARFLRYRGLDAAWFLRGGLAAWNKAGGVVVAGGGGEGASAGGSR